MRLSKRNPDPPMMIPNDHSNTRTAEGKGPIKIVGFAVASTCDSKVWHLATRPVQSGTRPYGGPMSSERKN